MCFWVRFPSRSSRTSSHTSYPAKPRPARLQKPRRDNFANGAYASRTSQLPPTIPSTVMLPAREACESKLTLGLYRNSVVGSSADELEAAGGEGGTTARTAAFREASWLFK